MDYSSLDLFLRRGRAALAKGPVALIFVEDAVEIESTVAHHLAQGFRKLVLLCPPHVSPSFAPDERVVTVEYETLREGAVTTAVTRISAAAVPGTWLYWGFNAEFLYYPFAESRSVSEMLTFHVEERRDAMLAYVIDLYAANLDMHPTAVSREDAHLDRSGYYALARRDPANGDQSKERQLDFFGGLRWRFEEHIPKRRRRIDRIALFRARPGLALREDHTFDDEELNTYACPWHHNLTAAVCSFRTAKALKANPGSRYDIPTFTWRNSVPFEWSSRQLLDLGLMEPGQWF